MDILAHGLWTHAIHRGVALKKNFHPSKKNIWLAVFFGVAPDLFSFGIFFVDRLFSAIFYNSDFLPAGPPDPTTIPSYVYHSYDYTHSLVIFLIVFGLLWLLRKKPYWLMYGWGLHILIDMFSHSTSFFPTPFLFPVADFKINGWSWGHPTFMALNYAFLLATYVALALINKRKNAAKVIY